MRVRKGNPPPHNVLRVLEVPCPLLKSGSEGFIWISVCTMRPPSGFQTMPSSAQGTPEEGPCSTHCLLVFSDQRFQTAAPCTMSSGTVNERERGCWMCLYLSWNQDTPECESPSGSQTLSPSLPFRGRKQVLADCHIVLHPHKSTLTPVHLFIHLSISWAGHWVWQWKNQTKPLLGRAVRT
jgi:hypothetical protein